MGGQKMRLDRDHSGSGTYATDEYRCSVGLKAANILSAGHACRTVVGDHTGSELCVEVIARINGYSPVKYAGSDATILNTITTAVHNLRAGLGVHKVASDHSGGNTCA